MASAQQFTQADVSAALSRLFVLPPEHEGIVRYSGTLLKTVNESPEFRKGGLQGGGFTALALGSAPGDLLAAVDPAQRDKLQREIQARANISSPESVALGIGLGGREGLRLVGRQDNSNRFTDLPDGERMTPAMLAAQALAHKTPGMEWAAHNRELLRIPGAVETLIQAKIREESYKAAKDVGFLDRDNVAATKWALKNGKDGNKVLDNMADSVRIFGGNDPTAQDRWRNLFNNYHAKPDDPKARQEMNEALTREESHPDPKHREQAKKTRELTELAKEAKKEADARATQASQNNDKLAALLGDDASTTTATLSARPSSAGSSGTAPTRPAQSTSQPGQQTATQQANATPRP
jgi:hypothetical protein